MKGSWTYSILYRGITNESHNSLCSSMDCNMCSGISRDHCFREFGTIMGIINTNNDFNVNEIQLSKRGMENGGGITNGIVPKCC